MWLGCSYLSISSWLSSNETLRFFICVVEIFEFVIFISNLIFDFVKIFVKVHIRSLVSIVI